MKVHVLAQTVFNDLPDDVRGTPFGDRMERDLATDEHNDGLDLLHEFAGRACYQSYSLPNEQTAENDGYMDNILNQQHYSVTEHGSVTFYVQHVSRALLLELERHRHISFSVESQRYVNTRKAHPVVVVPPAFDTALGYRLQQHYERSLDEYDEAYHTLRDRDFSIKEAREAARAFLPNATPVDFLVTGNIRAWRDVLGKRWHVAADAEIREFAGLVLDNLRAVAPASVQDIPSEPYGKE